MCVQNQATGWFLYYFPYLIEALYIITHSQYIITHKLVSHYILVSLKAYVEYPPNTLTGLTYCKYFALSEHTADL